MPREVRLHAHAKINLALRVWPAEPATSARPGWHRILSWAACIDLTDEIVVEPRAAGFELVRHCAADAPQAADINWPPESDLVWRAVQSLQARIGRSLPCRVRVSKRIPPGGGLGGGSSDAAATLMACNQAFELGLTAHELREVGYRLGSDVPLFIDDLQPARAALVSGFGEVLERVPGVTGDLTLILPRVGCPTPQVYQEFDRGGPVVPDAAEVAALVSAARQPRGELSEAETPSSRDGVSEASREGSALLVNDLGLPACRVVSEVGEVWRLASKVLSSRVVRMSGSGSTLWAPGRLGADEAAGLRAVLGARATVMDSRFL